jgi:hypothetical protein
VALAAAPVVDDDFESLLQPAIASVASTTAAAIVRGVLFIAPPDWFCLCTCAGADRFF